MATESVSIIQGKSGRRRRNAVAKHNEDVRGRAKRRVDDELSHLELAELDGENGEVLARFDSSKFDDDNIAELAQYLDQESDLSFFEGEVMHGYALKKAGGAEECPRCNADTEQVYAHFIYASHPIPRIMLAPTGHFCSECPP